MIKVRVRKVEPKKIVIQQIHGRAARAGGARDRAVRGRGDAQRAPRRGGRGGRDQTHW